MDRRVWVDFGQPGMAGQPFRIRVTTRYQPFGFRQSDQSKRLSRWEQRRARSDFDDILENAALKGQPDYKLPLSQTKPYGSKYPLDLRGLVKSWRDSDNNIDRWCQGTLARLSLADDAPYEEIAQRVREFAHALSRLLTMQIALVRVAPEIVAHDVSDDDEATEPALVVLFNRIANAGSPLSRADYVFSLIKHRFPEAHNLVERLHDAGNISSLISANDLVMTAVRLAANTHTHSGGTPFSDLPIPSPKEFGRMLRAKVDIESEDGDFLECALMPLIREGGRASLCQAFEEAQQLLSFRDGMKPSDPGLPKLAFPLLQRQLVQVLLLWIHRRQKGGESEEVLRKQFDGSRNEMLRFVLFWLLCVGDREKDKEAAGKAAFQMLREDHNGFPGMAIAKLLCEQKLAVPMEHPDAIEASSVSQPTSGTKLRGWYARFYRKGEDGTDIESHPVYSRWFYRNNLLLWLQRETLNATFKDADPLAGREEETPFDYDHICPSADWGTDYRSCGSPFKGFCEDHAGTLGNCIGNCRVWDSSANRSDGDAPATSKLGLDSPDSTETKELLQQSAIIPIEAEGWRACSARHEDQGEWDETRALAFQAIVENRAFRLFKQYFSEGGFDRWIAVTGQTPSAV